MDIKKRALSGAFLMTVLAGCQSTQVPMLPESSDQAYKQLSIASGLPPELERLLLNIPRENRGVGFTISGNLAACADRGAPYTVIGIININASGYTDKKEAAAAMNAQKEFIENLSLKTWTDVTKRYNTDDINRHYDVFLEEMTEAFEKTKLTILKKLGSHISVQITISAQSPRAGCPRQLALEI